MKAIPWVALKLQIIFNLSFWEVLVILIPYVRTNPV